jgi:hypothetical protein
MAVKEIKIVLLVLVSIGIGVLIGGYLFSQSQPRSILSIDHCQDCLSREEFLGLAASVGIQKFPRLIPLMVFETDKTVVMKHPFSKQRNHYMIIPKKDIKNIGEISGSDTQYLVDAFFVARRMIEEKKLSKYRLSTNGPGFQDVTYLHFHLVAE